eukprot:CAMPEP_0180032134 /NCGR_PEP_ID=MMETSP0984-20121128/28291_1 /TAXON_ID=483367 /ORGANISM="non described non described, Strain CCMP 2436" /LENGTH=95 /DNA_ID=CAMNT_0021957341 /DNA_START=19 /DNA_END=305 /DNA_ORIENTATION=+
MAHATVCMGASTDAHTPNASIAIAGPSSYADAHMAAFVAPEERGEARAVAAQVEGGREHERDDDACETAGEAHYYSKLHARGRQSKRKPENREGE